MSKKPDRLDNKGMDELIRTLIDIGLPDAEIQRIRDFYREDYKGLRDNVLYIRAMIDDRHEYV